MACRDLSRAEQAAETITTRVKSTTSVHPNVSFLGCDLCSLASVKRFALEFKSRFDRLDLLILNAGIGNGYYSVSEDGYEATFQTNHLGHFYLTSLLIDVLVKSRPSRVVVVSSEAHR
jgi:WW domain-containing oxidoreductase